MAIYLVQHGKPVSKEDNPDRPLSEQGKKDVERVGRFLTALGVHPEEVFHSGKTRAKETAETLASKIDPQLKPKERRGLSPMDDAGEIAEDLKKGGKEVLLVGHLPHLGKLVSLLTTGEDSNSVVAFQQGAVVCLKPDQERKLWAVAWMVTPEILR